MSSRASIRKRVIGKHLAVLAVYGLLSLLFTWPLVAHLATHVPGDGIDDPALVWNLWWIQERLINQLNPELFHVDWMFYPIRINLAFYTLTPLNGLLSVPLQSAFGLVFANNVLFLSTLVSECIRHFPADAPAALASHDCSCAAVDRRLSHQAVTLRAAPFLSTDDWIALVAGLVYGFASSKLFYASLGQFNIASSQWIPFFVLFLISIPWSRNSRTGFPGGADGRHLPDLPDLGGTDLRNIPGHLFGTDLYLCTGSTGD